MDEHGAARPPGAAAAPSVTARRLGRIAAAVALALTALMLAVHLWLTPQRGFLNDFGEFRSSSVGGCVEIALDIAPAHDQELLDERFFDGIEFPTHSVLCQLGQQRGNANATGEEVVHEAGLEIMQLC